MRIGEPHPLPSQAVKMRRIDLATLAAETLELMRQPHASTLGLDIWGLNPSEKSIWFGIVALLVVEIGLITPPVGMNVYIINSLAGDVPMRETLRGVVPFLLSDAVRITLLLCFPVLSLWLVRMLG